MSLHCRKNFFHAWIITNVEIVVKKSWCRIRRKQGFCLRRIPHFFGFTKIVGDEIDAKFLKFL